MKSVQYYRYVAAGTHDFSENCLYLHGSEGFSASEDTAAEADP